MTLMPWSRGKHLAWDYTCNDTLASTYMSTKSVRAKFADRHGEMKLKHYEDLANSRIVMPVVIEFKLMGSDGVESY